jgi:hypothetical protein
MLDAEMDVHLGEAAQQMGGNHRNGTSAKTVDTGSERVVLDIPRDRHGRFDPVLIGKDQRRLSSNQQTSPTRVLMFDNAAYPTEDFEFSSELSYEAPSSLRSVCYWNFTYVYGTCRGATSTAINV